MRLGIALVMLLLPVATATAQSSADIETTCFAMTRLTHDALTRRDAGQVLIYIRAAEAIRKARPGETCHAAYFTQVQTENAAVLDSYAVVISVVGSRPIVGWRHREIDELFTAVANQKPVDVIRLQQMIPKQMLRDWSSVRITDQDELIQNLNDATKNVVNKREN